MSVYDVYNNLFHDDDLTKYDPYPIHTKQYFIQRELNAVNMVGINYNIEADMYTVRVVDTTRHNQYILVGEYYDMIEALIAYDTFAMKHDINTKLYVQDGVRTNKGKSKYFTKSVRDFVDKYYSVFTVKDLSKLLNIPNKEIYKYIHRVNTNFDEPSKSPDIVVWDVRSKYEDAIDKLKHTGKLTIDDIDNLLELGD